MLCVWKQCTRSFEVQTIVIRFVSLDRVIVAKHETHMGYFVYLLLLLAMISHNSNWLHCDVCVCAQTGEQKEHGYNRNFTRYIFFSKGVSHSTRSVQVNFRDFPHKTPFKCVSLMFHRPIGPLLGASSGGIRRNKYSYESVDDLRCTFKVKVMPLPLVSSEFKVQQV